MLILFYEKLYGIYATLCLLVLSCVDKLESGLRVRFELVLYYSLVLVFKYMEVRISFVLFFGIRVQIYGLNLGLAGST